jgi:trehalose-phosphatase
MRVPALQASGLVIEDRTYALVLHFRGAEPPAQIQAAEEFGRIVAAEGLRLRRGSDAIEACVEGGGLGRAALGLLAGFKPALAIYVGAGDPDEDGFQAIHRAGGLTVHVGTPPRAGTAARFHVADSGEVIRLIHWLADARRRLH